MMFELSVSHSRHYNRSFLSPKSRPPIDLQPNVVYKIPCADCPWNYVGETGRCFETRKKEHVRNVKSFARGSNIAKHAWSSNHSIDFKNSQVIDKGSSRIRKTLESWHTASTSHAITIQGRSLINTLFFWKRTISLLTLKYIFFSHFNIFLSESHLFLYLL